MNSNIHRWVFASEDRLMGRYNLLGRLHAVKEHMLKYNMTFRDAFVQLVSWKNDPYSDTNEEGTMLYLRNGSPEIVREHLHEDRHTGWYTDCFCDETARGAAVVLRRFGRKRVFEAVLTSCNDDYRVDLTSYEDVDSSECEDEYDFSCLMDDALQTCARCGDDSARKLAEEEKEYSAKQQAEQVIEEAGEDIAKLRKEARELLSSTRKALARIRFEISEKESEIEKAREDPWSVS